jgi:hypothetical protein
MNKSFCFSIALLVAVSSPVSANPLIKKGLTALGAVADVDQLISKDGPQNNSPDTGSNIGGLILDQDVEIVGGEFDGATVSLNDLLVSNSNIALLIGEQVVEIEDTSVSQSTIVANVISVEDSNAGYFDIEQVAEFINSTVQGSSIQVNVTAIQDSNLIGTRVTQNFSSDGVTFSNTNIRANDIRKK